MRLLRSCLILSAISGLVSPVQAQEGSRSVLSFAQSLVVEEGDLITGQANNAYLRTDLDFQTVQTTDVSELTLLLGGALHIDDNSAERTFEFRDPRVLLGFVRDTPTTQLGIDGSFQRFRIRDSLPDADFDETALIFDSGDRQEAAIIADWRTSVEVPIGFGIRGEYREIRFIDTLDPGLQDEDRAALDGNVDFRLSPITTVSLVGGVFDRSVADIFPREEEGAYAGLGLRQAVNETLTFTGELRYERRDRQDIVGMDIFQITNQGTTGSLGLLQDVQNGSWRADFDSTLLLDGTRQTLTVGRSLLLPLGSLTIDVGLGQSTNADLRPLFLVDYLREGPRSRFTVLAEQQFFESTDNIESQRTAIAVNYLSEINRVSSWEIGAAYGRTEELAFLEEVVERYFLELAYRRNLTQEWDVRAAYETNRFSGNLRETENVQRLVLSLERAFISLR